jgi:hypothetical protein
MKEQWTFWEFLIDQDTNLETLAWRVMLAARNGWGCVER